MRLVIIRCGKKKVWSGNPDVGPQKGKDTCTGGYFTTNKWFAKSRGCDWMILSAKYGFMAPDFPIPENYNVTFTKPATHPISTPRLTEQVEELGLGRYDEVTVLGGVEYVKRIREAYRGTGARIEAPFAGYSNAVQEHMVNYVLQEDLTPQGEMKTTVPRRK